MGVLCRNCLTSRRDSRMESWHRGELFSFDPSENLQNSMYAGEKSESCSSCSGIYTAYSPRESAYIYTCRCELIFHSYAYRYLQNLQTKECQEGSHLM